MLYCQLVLFAGWWLQYSAALKGLVLRARTNDGMFLVQFGTAPTSTGLSEWGSFCGVSAYRRVYRCTWRNVAAARTRVISALTRDVCDLQRNMHLPHCSRCIALERVLHSPAATPNSHDTVYVTLTAPFLRCSFYCCTAASNHDKHNGVYCVTRSQVNTLTPRANPKVWPLILDARLKRLEAINEAPEATRLHTLDR